MRYKKAKPGDALSFPAGLQNDLIDLLASREAGNGFSAGLLGRFAQGVIVNVKNTSGADRARWENMALSTLRFAIGADGKESVIFNAIAGDPAKPPAILQEPIANNKYGRALIFGYTLARVAAGSTTLETAKPNASHKLTPDAGGTVRLLAAPSVSAETVIPVVVGFGATGGGTGLAKSPAGGIPARSGIIPGVATCNVAELYNDAGTIKIREKSPAVAVLIYNTTSVVVSAATWIHWKTDGGFKVVDVDDCA